ncbi:hypothetical protein [Ktedonobacter robiniae]|nr:hypothetical protein [Ktedonobacter robiniae]
MPSAINTNLRKILFSSHLFALIDAATALFPNLLIIRDEFGIN